MPNTGHISNSILKWELENRVQVKNANEYLNDNFIHSTQDCRLVSMLFITKCLYTVGEDVVVHNSKVGVMI